MNDDKPNYLAFLVRLWQAGDDGEPTWHASIDNPHTAERRYFADLEALYAFFVEQTDSCRARTEDAAATI
jgi:hypothetical protein